MILAQCIEGPRLLPCGTVDAFGLSGHWGHDFRAWWLYARHAFGSFAEGGDGGRSQCIPCGECTADEAIGESIALDP